MENALAMDQLTITPAAAPTTISPISSFFDALSGSTRSRPTAEALSDAARTI